MLGLSACQTKSQPDPAVNQAFNEYLNRRFDEMLHRMPEFASSLGLKYNYGAWNDRSIEFDRKELDFKMATLDSLKAFDQNKLDEQSLMSLRLYEEDVKNGKERPQMGRLWL